MSLSGAAGELVLAEAAIDDVITPEAIDLVVAGIAIDDVGALGAEDLVVALGAGNRVNSIFHADGDGLLEGQAARILDLQFDLMGRRGLEIELRAVSHESFVPDASSLKRPPALSVRVKVNVSFASGSIAASGPISVPVAAFSAIAGAERVRTPTSIGASLTLVTVIVSVEMDESRCHQPSRGDRQRKGVDAFVIERRLPMIVRNAGSVSNDSRSNPVAVAHDFANRSL